MRPRAFGLAVKHDIIGGDGAGVQDQVPRLGIVEIGMAALDEIGVDRTVDHAQHEANEATDQVEGAVTNTDVDATVGAEAEVATPAADAAVEADAEASADPEA